MLFNSPILSMAGSFFSMECLRPPLPTFLTMCIPAGQDTPSFFRIPASMHRVMGWHQTIQSIPYPDSIKYRK
jgi:hypothetical protein